MFQNRLFFNSAPGQIRAAPQRIQGLQQPKPQQQQHQFGFQHSRQNFQQINYQKQPFAG